MKFQALAITFLALHSNSLANASPVGEISSVDQAPSINSSYLEQLASNHLAIWSGQFDLVSQTWAPGVHLYQDLLPENNHAVNLSVTNSTAYLAFIQLARSGYSNYTFDSRYTIPGTNMIAIRWTADAVLGPNIDTYIPQSTKAPGDLVCYNGTDILLVDPTTGLVFEVDSAWNEIDYFYQLGFQDIQLVV